MSPRCGAWTRTALPGPGRSAYELLDALGTDIRSLLLMASNPVVSAPRAAHIEERIRSLDFLAVCDVVLSETAALADVVLPVTQWAEETGTTTNLEGRVLLRRRAITPPEGVRSDLEVLHELAAAAGRGEGLPDRPRGGLRGAAPGERGRPGGLLGDHLPQAGGGERGVLAVPGPGGDGGFARDRRYDGHGAPRYPPSLPRPLRHPRRTGPVRPRLAPARSPRNRTTSTRCC